MREMPEAEKRQTRRMQNKNEFLANVCVMFCVVDFVKVVSPYCLNRLNRIQHNSMLSSLTAPSFVTLHVVL